MKISQDVLRVLSASTVSGLTLTLPEQLDRKLYLETAKVIEALGGKWHRPSKCHVFSDDAEERVDQAIMSGEVEIPKDEFDFFPTPAHIVKQMCDAADLSPGLVVLEPSAGDGAIVRELLGRVRIVTAFELRDVRAPDNLPIGVLSWNQNQDFLIVQPMATAAFDRILMNPPFSKRRDIEHILHAHKFLKPGGRLVAIASAGVSFREDRKAVEFRDAVYSSGGFIEPLPEGSFKSSGTMVNTVLVVMEK